MAYSDNKTTEEEEAGWEESAASLIISGKKIRTGKTLPIGTRLINKVLSERGIRGKREWLDSIFPKDCLQSLNRGY